MCHRQNALGREIDWQIMEKNYPWVKFVTSGHLTDTKNNSTQRRKNKKIRIKIVSFTKALEVTNEKKQSSKVFCPRV